jgi:hypothetical protein
VREGKRVGGAEMAASIIAAFERRGIEATPPQPGASSRAPSPPQTSLDALDIIARSKDPRQPSPVKALR